MKAIKEKKNIISHAIIVEFLTMKSTLSTPQARSRSATKNKKDAIHKSSLAKADAKFQA